MTDAFPFELNSESVNDWLATLAPFSASDKINQLYKVIKKLNGSAVEAQVLCSVLDALTPAILAASNNLEQMVIGGKAPSSTDKTKKLADFAIRLIQTLCFTYCNISNDSTLPKAQQALTIYKAMQTASLLTRCRTVFYRAPDPVLWARIGELYLNAKALDMLSLNIEDVVFGPTRQPTIEAVLKQTLLFSICNAYPYSPAEISEIFSAAGKLCHLLKLDPNPSESCVFAWNPESLTPPQYSHEEEESLYINTAALIDYFEADPALRENYATFLLTLNRLTAYEPVRESADPLNHDECSLAVGTDRATQFLKLLIKKYRILELSGVIAEQSRPSKLELEPMEHEKNMMGFLATKILKEEKPAFVINLRAYATHNPRFYTARIKLDCSIGEPLVFISENKKPLLGVIRYLRIEPVINVKNILLEILDGDAYPIEIDGKEGFIIKHQARETEMLLAPDDYAKETTLSIEKGLINGTFRIDKFIESTPHFMRFQVGWVAAV